MASTPKKTDNPAPVKKPIVIKPKKQEVKKPVPAKEPKMVEFEGQMISEDELNAAMSQAMEQSKSAKFEMDMEKGASIAAR